MTGKCLLVTLQVFRDKEIYFNSIDILLYITLILYIVSHHFQPEVVRNLNCISTLKKAHFF